MFGEFLGHGIFAYQAVPHFQFLLTNTIGVSPETAGRLLPFIGVIDIIIAGFALLHPMRAILLYAAAWGFLTALSRPWSGLPVWDFVERWPNWGVPLALLLVRGWPKSPKEWLR